MVVTTAKDVAPVGFFCRRIVCVVPFYWLATLPVIARAVFENLRYSTVEIAKSLLFVPYLRSFR
jgi:hypothetical protein